jgi:hypothetical protein
MFVALSLTFVGMGIGFLLRKHFLPQILARCIMPSIMLLLLSLGISLGSDQALVDALPRLGGTALLLSLGGIGGSLLFARFIRPCFPRASPPATAAKTPRDRPEA